MTTDKPRKKSRSQRHQRPKRYGTTKKSVLLERSKDYIEEVETRANERFDREERVMGFPDELPSPKNHKFEWQTNPVPLKDEEALAKFVVKKGEFGWLEDSRVDEIGQFVNGKNMNLDQALSLRSALLQQKTVYSHGRLKSKAKSLFRLYNEGVSVVDLSKRFDFPPMNIFRIILAEKRWSKSRIKECLREPSKMKKREQEEFEKAEAADRVSNVDQSETHSRADLFEEVLADWFESRGVNLRRQNEMVSEQRLEHGRPINTPDILFLDHVEINGQPVAWIDAKHFYGADVSFQRKKMTKQMSRYIEEWGSGAVVYRHGFSENLFIPGCLMLDAENLDLSKMA
ncbi:MAG: TPD domain-containing protein [Candidatus Poseidoniaceae archaeon]